MPEPAGPPRSGRALGAAPIAGVAGAALALLLAASPARAAEPAPAPGPPRVQCSVTDERLPELSGLAVAGDHLVAINDGGSSIAVYVLDAGCRVADVRTAPVDPYDPEDLALGRDGTVWLADIGDNARNRPTVALLALRPDGKTAVFRLSYPDGPHDAESLLLAPDGTPYLVTKEPLGASSVYRPTRPLADGATVPLARVAEVTFTLTGTEGGPVGRAGQLMATGGAVSADGRFLAVRTYTDAYVWPLTGADVPAALAQKPRRVPLPASRQGEAITFAANNLDLVVSGEGVPVDVTVVPTGLQPPAAAAATRSSAPGAGPTTTARSSIASALLAAGIATLVVWVGSTVRRRREP